MEPDHALPAGTPPANAPRPDAAPPVPENVSRRITAIRWLVIAAVVFCHAMQQPYYAVNFDLSAFFRGTELSGSLWYTVPAAFIFYGFCYGAPATFAMFSGYLQFIRPRPYGETVRRRVRSLLLPLVLWTALVCGLYMLGTAVYGNIGRFAFLRGFSPAAWFAGTVGNYVSYPAWIRGPHTGEVYQLWFLRDLFVLVLASPLIGWLMRRRGTGLAALAVFAVILHAGWRPVICGADMLFYYSLGVFCARHGHDFFAAVDRWCPWPAVLALAAAAAWRMCGHFHDDLSAPAWLQLCALLAQLKISATIARTPRLSAWAGKLESQAFFLYGAHAYPVLLWLSLFILPLFPLADAWGILAASALMFLADLGIVTAAGFAVKRFMPRVFALLTGGRPAKPRFPAAAETAGRE